MINIKNSRIKLFIEIALNKKIDDIDESELSSLKNISFVCEAENHGEDFDILRYMPKVKNIYVENYQLTQEDVDKLFKTNCDIITFKRCLFDDSLSIPDNFFREMHFQNCLIENYDSIIKSNKSMEVFGVNNPYDENEINCSLLPESLKALILNYCILNNTDSLSNLKNTNYLSVMGTSFSENGLGFLSEMSSLEKLYISDRYKDSEEIKTIGDSCSVKHDFIDLLFDNDEEAKESGNQL